MSERENLYAIVARIDANVQSLAQRSVEDREAMNEIAKRTDKLESFKDRALAIVAAVGVAIGFLKDAVSGAVAHAFNLH